MYQPVEDSKIFKIKSLHSKKKLEKGCNDELKQCTVTIFPISLTALIFLCLLLIFSFFTTHFLSCTVSEI